MNLFKIENPMLTTTPFRKGHDGVDVFGDSITSTKLDFKQIADFDFIGQRNGKSYVSILHAKKKGNKLITAHDKPREAIGRWSGHHFHISMIGSLKEFVSPIFLCETYQDIIDRKMLALPILELCLPLSKHLEQRSSFEFHDLITYLQILMKVEGAFALDNGVRRIYGYRENLWLSEYKYNEFITFSKLIKPYIFRALKPTKDEYKIPFLRRLDLSFQYPWGMSMIDALGKQRMNYPGRVIKFSQLGGSYGGFY